MALPFCLAGNPMINSSDVSFPRYMYLSTT